VLVPVAAASNGHDAANGAREQDGQPALTGAQAQAPVVVASVGDDVADGAREHGSDVSADRPEPPPDDRPRGGRRTARNGARERARGHAREQRARVSGDEVRAMVRDAREQLLASPDGKADDDGIAEVLAARDHPISASRVRGYLAELKQRGELGPAFPARRPRVLVSSAVAAGATAKEA
jgi:hypothetical protein